VKKTILILAALTLAAPAWAFRFYPIVMEFTPAGEGASRAFYADNNGEESIAIQISMMTRSMDLDGAELNEDAAELFLVYPAQMVLSPGRRQAVRVQWLGPTEPTRELSFRIVAEQLPVTFESERAAGDKIDILFRYVGAVYITPRGAEPDIIVDSAAVESYDESGPYLSITLTNAGTAHTILADLEVTAVTQNGTPILTLSGEELEGMVGENLLAGASRLFRVPIGVDIASRGPVNAHITFTPTK
jgi:fimbrial chaperone protein